MSRINKTMKRTLKVPRGPPEWGEILYEPRWVYVSKYREFGRIMGHLFIFVFGSVVSFFMILSALFDNRKDLIYPLCIFFSIAILGSIYEILILYKSMPFRIYKKGVTKPSVPFRRGLQRQEVLIPFSRIVSIRFNKWHSITLGYSSEDGKKKKSLIDDHSPDDIDIIEDTMIKKVKSIEIIDRRS